MKRSRVVRLTLVASSATVGALPACSTPRQEAMHCVERGTDRVVPDSLCGPATAASGRTVSTTHVGGYGGYAPYLWYYGGGMQRGFMRSGGYAPMQGSSYRSSSGYSVGRSSGASGSVSGGDHGVSTHGGVSRGGFGATAAGHAGGG